MSTWSEGYVSEIEYTHGFYRELTPPLLAFCMLLKGLRPPSLTAPFAYCELGCGQGVTANLIAATNPQATVWATDFNPAHIISARSLAESAGIGNVRFLDKSFAEFLDLDTPEFDYITLHGIYSWVSPENRATIVEIIRRKLKPGGIVYVSYNCLPGWAASMPLQNLMVQHAAASNEPVLSRLEKAMGFAMQLSRLNSAYFTANPGVAKYLENIQGMPQHYLVHEYFNRNWTPMYFAEVAQELEAGKLVFGAPANPAESVDAVNMTAEVAQFIGGIPDPVFRETVRDYFVNQRFRKDIFVKGAARLTPQEQTEGLLATRFALITARAAVPMKATFPVGEIELHTAVYGPILDALAEGPATLRALAERSELKPLGPSRLVQALAILTALEQVSPCLPAEGDRERAEAVARFNAAVIRQAHIKDELPVVASPVTGAGVRLNRFDQLFLQAHREGKDPAEWVWAILSRQGKSVVKDGKALEKPEENLAALREMADTFRTHALPGLQRLGIT